MCLGDLFLIISLHGVVDARVDPPHGMIDAFIPEMWRDMDMYVCVCVHVCVFVGDCILCISR